GSLSLPRGVECYFAIDQVHVDLIEEFPILDWLMLLGDRLYCCLQDRPFETRHSCWDPSGLLRNLQDWQGFWLDRLVHSFGLLKLCMLLGGRESWHGLFGCLLLRLRWLFFSDRFFEVKLCLRIL